MYKSKVKVTLVLDVSIITEDIPNDMTVAIWKKSLTRQVSKYLNDEDWTEERISRALREYKILKTEKN